MFEILDKLEKGQEKVLSDELNKVNFDVKADIMKLFKEDVRIISGGDFAWKDKLPWIDKNALDGATDNNQSKTEKTFRMCPGAWVRRGVYIGNKVILMPCFVNIGAYIDDETMIDSGVTIGSCAYIGKRCHISSNVVIAGVLEPMQAMPVVIEDDCFIGAGCVIAEGMRVGKNSVIAAGCVITASTRIYNRTSESIKLQSQTTDLQIDQKTHQKIDQETDLLPGDYFINQAIPSNSLIVPGSYSCENGLNINCAVIIKNIKNRSTKTSLNDLLRD